eukprot:TRINITY_DN5589_c0_g1_i2.p1 TRINITY_DN5589_c0_g1~~TRINITY_DN5589_c0_g1_i2.p1  ORF type:complete len:668 (+),score=230.85 TRINITY_DN5589_c0_g1_i2:81-2084(+)
MALRAQSYNDVRVYNLTAGPKFSNFLSAARRRELSKTSEAYRQRIQLLQDFDFNTSSSKVKVSKDGYHVVASGVYPPMIKVFDVRDLSMKFERHMDGEVVQFLILSEDFGKLVFLQTDRSVEFHAPYGKHYRIRIPKFGRDMKYYPETCDLFVAASGSDIYRINLDEGKFMAPLESISPAVNCLAMNPQHQLLAAGGEDGFLECWDPKTLKSVAQLNLAGQFNNTSSNANPEITALRFDGPLNLAVGSKTGVVVILDVRSSQPMIRKEHQYGEPIKCIKYHQYAGVKRIMTADTKLIKVWDPETGEIFVNIDAPADINHFFTVKASDLSDDDSGLIFIACEDSNICAMFVPELGPAPSWCSFIDSITEEMEEEKSATVYDDYKFVTKDDLAELGLGHLIGTPLLKAYMHGFFMDIRLYKNAKAVANPFAFEQHRKQRIKEHIEKKNEQRIVIRSNLPKVNAEMAEKLMGEKSSKASQGLLTDDRFKAMFEDDDFAMNEYSDEFKLKYPSGLQKGTRGANNEMDSDMEDNDALDNDSDVESSEPEGKPESEWSSENEDSEIEESDDDIGHLQPKMKKRKGRDIKMTAMDTKTLDKNTFIGYNSEKAKLANARLKKKQKTEKKSFAARLAEMNNNENINRVGAKREFTFVPDEAQEKRYKQRDMSHYRR